MDFAIAGAEAVKQHRISKLSKGQPFMINSPELPSNKAYMEYPDGSVKLVSLTKGSRHFTFVKELTLQEAGYIKAMYLPK